MTPWGLEGRPPGGRERRSGAERRASHNWQRITRDFWLFLVTVVMLAMTVIIVDSQHKIQEGRRVATGITCAVVNAVAQGGEDVITMQSTAPETSFSRFLEAHGYPPQRVRAQQANQAAAAYRRDIAQRIERQVGRKGDRLVRADGSIDCNRLRAVVGAG